MSFVDEIFNLIIYINNLYWSYIGWVLIVIVGTYLTVISRALQFRALFNFRKNLNSILAEAKTGKDSGGIHPLKLYFASVGGMVGLGNIVGISIALMIGGPGSIFWTLIASSFGMLLKYSEIYLGIKYRVKNESGSFDGGPMYYLQKAFNTKFFAYAATLLICLYGVETYQFLVLVDRIEHSFDLNRNIVIFALLILVIYTVIGGINRIANICTVLMPIFMIIYMLITIYIVLINIHIVPAFFETVIISAFKGQAPIGGFAGSTMILASYLGVSRTVYSGDIGIGYDSIVQSETRIVNPKKQANMAIYALFTDTLICVLTNTMLGVTGAWYELNHLTPSDLVSTILADYFPYSDLFMTVLLFFAGFTTIIAYLAAGTKCARFICPKYGRIIYLLYAIVSFVLFCSLSQEKVIIFMELISGMLVLINVAGILKLRKELEF